MNKTELVDAMADAADISKAAAGRALDGLINGITEALKTVISLRYWFWLIHGT